LAKKAKLERLKYLLKERGKKTGQTEENLICLP
jgi:hypothetical protein